MKIKIFISCLICFMAACTVSKPFEPTASDVADARKENADITLTDLQAGYKLYARNCSGCHLLHKPGEFSEMKWIPILDKMFVKAKMTDVQKKELLKQYVLAKAK